MDENEDLTAAEPTEQAEEKQPKQKKRKAPARTRRSKTVGRILTGVLTLLLIALAVLVFVYRDTLTGENLRKFFGRDSAAGENAREAYTYETGAEQVFAAAGDGLAVASTSSVQLLNASGETVFKQVVSYDSPAVFGSSAGALFCDLGGNHGVYADFDGESRSPAPGGDILTAGMNENGWFYIVTAEAGYKALVSVYNSACEKQFEWWSGSGYVLRAGISPDNKSLTVLCTERDCTKLHFFALNSETERASVTLADVLLFDMAYLGGDTVCAVGETGLWFFTDDGAEKGVYALDGRYLLDYEIGRAGFAALYVSAYRSGAGGTLLTLDGSGRELGSAALERDVTSLSATGKHLLVMSADGLALYNQELQRQYAVGTLMTAKRALLRPAGDILLLYAYSAEKFSF